MIETLSATHSKQRLKQLCSLRFYSFWSIICFYSELQTDVLGLGHWTKVLL